jgi:hypothetical protein
VLEQLLQAQLVLRGLFLVVALVALVLLEHYSMLVAAEVQVAHWGLVALVAQRITLPLRKAVVVEVALI